jgi:hypothetical protein
MRRTTMSDKKKSNGRRCPACSGSLKSKDGRLDLDECRRCEAVVSQTMYKGDSFEVVLPFFETGSYEPEEQRYFDLTVVGSEGVERRHGWYLPRTRRMTQVG